MNHAQPDKTTLDILDRIAKDSRLMRCGQSLPPHGALTWEQVARVQDDLRVVVENGLSTKRIARAMGEATSHTTLVRFLQTRSRDEADGIDMDRIARIVNQWLRSAGGRAAAKLPDGFVETTAARMMLTVIGKAIELNTMAVIYSDAGRGKSMTLTAAKEIHPGSVLVRVLESTRTATSLVKHLAAMLNIRGADKGLKAQQRVVAAMYGTCRALMVDEAHRLSPGAIELLRDLHDEAGVPVILVGTARLLDIVDDQASFYGQLTSRIALRLNLCDYIAGDTSGGGGPGPSKPLHTVDEIKQVFESDKVRLTDDGRELLTRIANLPGLGGLRLVKQIISVASMAAGGQAIDATLVRRVVRAMHGTTHAAATIEAAVERSRAKVA